MEDKDLDKDVSEFIEEVYQTTLRSYLIEKKQGHIPQKEKLSAIIQKHLDRLTALHNINVM